MSFPDFLQPSMLVANGRTLNKDTYFTKRNEREKITKKTGLF